MISLGGSMFQEGHCAGAAGQQSASSAGDAADDIEKIAADYAALDRANAPRDALPDRSESAITAAHLAQDRLLDRLHAIDPRTLKGSSAIAHAILLQNVE